MKWESELSAFIPLFGQTRAEETFSSNALRWSNIGQLHRMNFTFLAVAIQKQSFITSYKHIYIVNATKSSKSFSKNNLKNRSCKLDFPNISSLDDDLIEFSYLLFNILSSFKRL